MTIAAAGGERWLVVRDSAVQVRLEVPSARRAQEFLAAVRRSRVLHRGLSTPPRTAEQYRAYLRRVRQPSAIGYFVCLRTGELAGVININEIVRGSFQSGYLGYYAFAAHARRGYMHAGLRLVLARAFGRHRLHRLEANIQPGNAASIAMVRRCGFRREGLSPRYLKIAGRWRDHERWAMTAEDWRTRKRR
jgi:ribosomal-protein-alanine N-acetyltransferase